MARPGFLPRLLRNHGALPQARGITRKMSLLRQQQQQQPRRRTQQEEAELHQKISPGQHHHHHQQQQQPDLHQQHRSMQQPPPPPRSDVHGIFVNEYEQYRRALCGPLSYKALLVDAAGTLIVPSEPAAKVYHDFGVKYGVEWSETEILARYRWAYAQPWSRSRLRYEDDARPFWRFIVENSTGCNDPAYLEELYQYYTTAEAWRIADPEAGKIFKALRQAGVKVAVVSNFDTRLRPLMKALRCHDWFDAMAISAEVGLEKPNPAIFSAACELLGVHEEEAVHVGDDRRNDLWGARDAGCDAWLWGEDVKSFHEVAEQIGVGVPRRGSFEGCPALSQC